MYIESVEFRSTAKGFDGQYFVALLGIGWYWNREMIPIDAADVVSSFYGISFSPSDFGEKLELRNDYREFHFWKVDQPQKNCIVFANESVIAYVSSNKRSHSYGYFCENKTVKNSNADQFMAAIMKLRRKDNSYNGRGLRFWESG